MNNQDIELDDIVDDEGDSELEEASSKETSGAADARRRLEDKLEEARLRRMLNDYDYDFD